MRRLRRCRAGGCQPGRGRRGARGAAGARGQPHRHGCELRRLRAPPRSVAADAPRTRSSLPRRPASGLSAARERDRRSLERLGVDGSTSSSCTTRAPAEWERPWGGRRAPGCRRGARRRARTLHRRDRTRLDCGRDAPAQPRAVPVRLGAPTVHVCPDAGLRLRGGFGGARWPRAPNTVSLSRRSRPSVAVRGVEGADCSHLVRAAQHPEDIELAVRWVLGRPEVFLNTAGTAACCAVLEAAERFESRPPEGGVRATRRNAAHVAPVRVTRAGASAATRASGGSSLGAASHAARPQGRRGPDEIRPYAWRSADQTRSGVIGSRAQAHAGRGGDRVRHGARPGDDRRPRRCPWRRTGRPARAPRR